MQNPEISCITRKIRRYLKERDMF